MLGSGTQKQRADLLSSSAASFTKTKATISPLPGLGWITVPKKLKCVCVRAPPSFTTTLPCYLYSSIHSLYRHTKNDQRRTFVFTGHPYVFRNHTTSKSHFLVPSRFQKWKINTTVAFDADVRVDQKVWRQML